MLSTLRIENIAIIDSLEIEFTGGLNVLTGETGAGKSIILKAISLLSGKRMQGNLIRHGASKAIIEGLFILSLDAVRNIGIIFDELNDVLESDEILIRRVIDASGRSRFYINGSLFPLGTVSRIAPYLFEITGQHEQQNLLTPMSHRNILDASGVSSELLEQVGSAYFEWKRVKEKLDSIKSSQEEQKLRIERLEIEKEELEQANVQIGEKENIKQELSKLQFVENIQSALQESLSFLDPGNSDSYTIGVEEGIQKVSVLVESAKRHDSKLETVSSLLDDITSNVNELRLQIEDYLSDLSHNPDQLEQLQIRLTDLNRLERKYSMSSDELPSYLDKISLEISEIEGGSFSEEKLKSLLSEKEELRQSLEAKLTQERKLVSEKLSKAVNKGLQDLQLKKAHFSIQIKDTEPSGSGKDSINFLFTANPGEPAQPINQVASGGELSRLLLLLKSISGMNNSPSLQVFDEIDVGVSGAVAQIVGEKLLSISSQAQVIAITHSAQVAALADNHILVSKRVKNERTFSSVESLNKESRIKSIASMLAGKNVTKEFELSAKELMKLKIKNK